jgi:hypothetical protein
MTNAVQPVCMPEMAPLCNNHLLCHSLLLLLLLNLMGWIVLLRPQITSAALLAAAITWPPELQPAYSLGLAKVVFSYALTPTAGTTLVDWIFKWLNTMGLSLLIGTNLFVSLISCLNSYVHLKAAPLDESELKATADKLRAAEMTTTRAKRRPELVDEISSTTGSSHHGNGSGYGHIRLFRLQQALSAISLLLHNALVVSYSASGLSLTHTWKYPEPYK